MEKGIHQGLIHSHWDLSVEPRPTLSNVGTYAPDASSYHRGFWLTQEFKENSTSNPHDFFIDILELSRDSAIGVEITGTGQTQRSDHYPQPRSKDRPPGRLFPEEATGRAQANRRGLKSHPNYPTVNGSKPQPHPVDAIVIHLLWINHLILSLTK